MSTLIPTARQGLHGACDSWAILLATLLDGVPGGHVRSKGTVSRPQGDDHLGGLVGPCLPGASLSTRLPPCTGQPVQFSALRAHVRNREEN